MKMLMLREGLALQIRKMPSSRATRKAIELVAVGSLSPEKLVSDGNSFPRLDVRLSHRHCNIYRCRHS